MVTTYPEHIVENLGEGHRPSFMRALALCTACMVGVAVQDLSKLEGIDEDDRARMLLKCFAHILKDGKACCQLLTLQFRNITGTCDVQARTVRSWRT